MKTTVILAVMATAEVPRGEWIHLAGVFDGREVLMYRNGKVATRMAVPGNRSRAPEDRFGESNPPGVPGRMPATIKHSNSSLWIGRDKSGYSWCGKMDELVIYARALEAKEIAQLYHAGRPD